MALKSPTGWHSDPDKKFLLVFMFSSKFYISWSEIYVVRVEIVISKDSGMIFCKITLIVHNPFSISVFTVKRCTLRSFDFYFLYFCIPILLMTRFTYECEHWKRPASFLWDTPSLLLTNRLSFFWTVCWKFLLADHLRIGVLRSFQTQNDKLYHN